MIKLDSNSIGKIYLGSNSIGKAYLGSNLVFQKGSSPTPSIQPVFHDYLVFDGNSEIETSVVIPENGSLSVNLGDETQKVTQGVFRSATTDNGSIRHFLGGSTSSTTRNMVAYYDSTSYVDYQDLQFSSPRYSLFMTPNGWGWGNAYYPYTKGNIHPTGGIIFGFLGNGQRYTGRMKEFYVFGSDAQNATSRSEIMTYTPIATLRPCTYDGEAGLWHVEGGVFYGKTLGDGVLSVDDD